MAGDILIVMSEGCYWAEATDSNKGVYLCSMTCQTKASECGGNVLHYNSQVSLFNRAHLY